MPASTALIAGWARSAVAPHGTAFARLHAHEIGAPVVAEVLRRSGIDPAAVDAVVVGNALGAGGNPARLVALAARLPERCAAFTIDTQCCSGIDAVCMAVGLLACGQASVVVAGGVEAWSRAPIRQQRPLHDGEPAVAYERPSFCPDPDRDPDMLASAASYAARAGFTREQQDDYAIHSHQRALAAEPELRGEIVPIAGLQRDSYPRPLDPRRAARMPAAVAVPRAPAGAPDCSLSALSISARADGAAFIVLATPQACSRLGIEARAAWLAGASTGAAPQTPLLLAEQASRLALRRAGLRSLDEVSAVELHDAFAVQGLSFCRGWQVDPGRINRSGGGLARGHPIGASAAVALVRVLAELAREGAPGRLGLAAAAGAGGIGAAAVIQTV